MQTNFTEDLEEFAAIVGGWLVKNPAENNVILTAIEYQRAGQAKTDTATYGWVTDGGEILGAVRSPPPLAATMTAMPESAARLLADGLAARKASVPAINGPRECVEAFAAQWGKLTGQGAVHVRNMQLSQLDRVQFTQWPPGGIRRADPGEVELLIGWIATVLRDGGMPQPDVAARKQVMEQLAGGRLYVWEHEGKPVAVTGHGAPVHGVVRLAGGFTPPEYRTSWYGLAVAAAVADDLFKQGCTACMTITDESNPYAASLLRMIGFHPVLPLSEHRFPPGAEPR